MQRRGHTVTDTTAPDWMGYLNEIGHRVATINGSGSEPFASIHLNAGGGQAPRSCTTPEAAAASQRRSTNLVSVLGLRTINGKFGNGDARRSALGSNYDAAQRRVNEMLA